MLLDCQHQVLSSFVVSDHQEGERSKGGPREVALEALLGRRCCRGVLLLEHQAPCSQHRCQGRQLLLLRIACRLSSESACSGTPATLSASLFRCRPAHRRASTRAHSVAARWVLDLTVVPAPAGSAMGMPWATLRAARRRW
jgi:hypothetical protein